MDWKRKVRALAGKIVTSICLVGPLLLAAARVQAEDARIEVDASQVVQHLPRTLTGACLEDVNHEIYGGLYSQMIFGESFQEPGASALAGFQTFGGRWEADQEGELVVQGDPYPKAVGESAPLDGDGQAGVEIFFTDARDAVAGLIFHVEDAREGVDAFSGYEVALNPGAGLVRLARHRDSYDLLEDAPYPVPLHQWVNLSVRLTGTLLEVFVDGKRVIQHDDGGAVLRHGAVGIRQGRSGARYRRLWTEPLGSPRESVPFKPARGLAVGVSNQWRGFSTGSAVADAHLETQRPFVGNQSQRLTFVGGEGEVGVANLGLYGRPPVGSSAAPGGMNFVANQPYEGCVWARAGQGCALTVALESTDGTRVHAQATLQLAGTDEWQRLPFTLTSEVAEPRGRFAVRLTAPGSVTLGYALLQPGDWGRFQGLPVRRDVVQGLLDQGVTVLRYGGSMVNAEDYRWKHMVGPRERRPPYVGTWYPHSTNGWAVPDFLDLCEATGILGIPDLNVNETPQDLADFVEYVNGSSDTPWGRQRVADGHPAPYRLRYLELGNEEKVDDAYWQKFQPLAEAVWARDPEMVLVVGDFAYNQPIADSFRFTGADSGITTLAAQEKILALARAHDREVWFDVHMNTESPDPPSPSMRAFASYVDAIDRLAHGAKHRVAVFELNANTHDQNRALANARAILAAERLGERVPVVISANALQPDGHHDNGWDQGLLFLDPARVWLQPPGYVTQLLARHYEPLLVRCAVTPAGTKLDGCATRSEDGRVLVLQVVNPTGVPVSAQLAVTNFALADARGSSTQLAGTSEVNTAQQPLQLVPTHPAWHPDLSDGKATYTFAPKSFTILRLERAADPQRQ